MHKFLWCDVETTGLDAKENGIHQLAGQIIVRGVLVDEFNFEFKPMESEKIEEKALAVSNLTIDDVMARDITSNEAYHYFKHKLETYVDKYNRNDKFVFCAYNAGFDSQFINEWFKKHGNNFFFGLCHGGAYFDPLTLALMYEMKMGKKVFSPNRKLATVAKHLGIKLENAHDALADIKATREVAKILWSKILK